MFQGTCYVEGSSGWFSVRLFLCSPLVCCERRSHSRCIIIFFYQTSPELLISTQLVFFRFPLFLWERHQPAVRKQRYLCAAEGHKHKHVHFLLKQSNPLCVKSTFMFCPTEMVSSQPLAIADSGKRKKKKRTRATDHTPGKFEGWW